MVDFSLRYAEKFTDPSGSTSYTFPTDDMEYEPAQAHRPAEAAAVGADYAHDYLGTLRWTKEVAEEPVRVSIWGSTSAAILTEFDTMCQKLINIGLGKLYTVDEAGTERWCWAKLAERPGYHVDASTLFVLPVTLRFRRFSDWYSTTATTGTVSVTVSPKTFTITNPGNARVTNLVVRLRSNNATGFTNPRLQNLTLNQQFDTTRDAASANSELRLDNEAMRVQWSTDDGSTYADDYANATLPATQVAICELDPGDNSMQYTDGGTPNFSLEYSFYAQWH